MTGKTSDPDGWTDPQDGEAGGLPDGRTGRGTAGVGVPRVVRGAGARTPEELETLLEDALVLRDGEALAGLFEEGAVLLAGQERPARGGEAIARLALTTWDGDRTYVADPRGVTQARDIALVLAQGGVNVVRRGSDGTWRYAIALLYVDAGTGRREPWPRT